MNNDLQLLTVQQVAELLQVKTSWVYIASAQGQLPSLKIGRHLRFRPSDLSAYLARAASDSAPPPVAAQAQSQGVDRRPTTATPITARTRRDPAHGAVEAGRPPRPPT